MDRSNEQSSAIINDREFYPYDFVKYFYWKNGTFPWNLPMHRSAWGPGIGQRHEIRHTITGVLVLIITVEQRRRGEMVIHNVGQIPVRDSRSLIRDPNDEIDVVVCQGDVDGGQLARLQVPVVFYGGSVLPSHNASSNNATNQNYNEYQTEIVNVTACALK